MGGFLSFGSPQTGAFAYGWLLGNDPNYAGVRAAARTHSPQAELAALANSPYDAGGYSLSELQQIYADIGRGSIPVNPTVAALAGAESTISGLSPRVIETQWQAENSQNLLGTQFWQNNNPGNIRPGNPFVDTLAGSSGLVSTGLAGSPYGSGSPLGPAAAQTFQSIDQSMAFKSLSWNPLSWGQTVIDNGHAIVFRGALIVVGLVLILLAATAAMKRGAGGV